MKKLSLLSWLVCLLIPGSAALSQPFPSFMLDTSRTLMPGFEGAGGTRVAFGQDLGLVVWVSRGVRGVRVDRNGAFLDSIQIDISGPDLRGGQPAVAWSGQNFLVAWADDEAMKYALVDPDGSIMARATLQDKEWSGSYGPAAAFDGTSFLVSWIGGNETLGRGALFCRISPDGTVLDRPPRFVAPHAVGEEGEVALCYHEDRYLAAWSAGDPSGLIGVSANVIFPDGSIADSTGFRIRSADGAGTPSVTHDRSHFLVSWYESGERVKLARVTDDGVVLDTGGILTDSFSSPRTAIVSNGDTTSLLFLRDSLYDRDSLTLVAVRVDASLTRIDVEPVKLSAPGYPGYGYAAEDPAAALCGDDYFITWVQPISAYPVEDVYQTLCRRMSRNGELLDSTPVVLSYEAATQCYPDVASDGENFLAVWNDIRRDPVLPEYSVYGSRFTAEGTLLDSASIWLGSSDYRRQPAAAFGDGCYLVVWREPNVVSAKRITPAGLVLDSAPLRMPEPYGARGNPDVAFGDSVFMVVWSTWSSIHGCRVTPAGAILDTAPLQLVVKQVPELEYPRVAFDGTNFLVARRDGDAVHRCLRASPQGAVLDTTDITVAGRVWGAPEIAFGNGIYFVVDNNSSRCWRVSPEGVLLDSVPHSNTDRSQVVFDGTDFMLLCDMRDSSGRTTNQLGGLRITPQGRVLDSTPFVLVTADSARAGAGFAAMATNAAHQMGIAFTSRERAPYLTTRIRAATFPAIVGIGSQREASKPVAFRVLPNPASRFASVSFNLTQAGPVRVSAFDAAGRRCASLFSGRMKAGQQTLPLDTRQLANGVYFLRLEAGAATHSARLVVSR